MKTLLQIGDKIKIRDDIEYYKKKYYMKNVDDTIGDTYTRNMLPPGSIATISEIKEIKGHLIYKVQEDLNFNYVDEMFDSELIEYLYKNR